jgi:hypothetical protein
MSDTPHVVAQRRRSRLLLYVTPVVWAIAGFGLTGGLGPGQRAAGAAAGFALGILVILARSAAALHSRGIPVRRLLRREIWIAPRRTSTVPAAVEDELPKAVWVARNREPERLRRLLVEGQLLVQANAPYTIGLAFIMAGSLIARASAKSSSGGMREAVLYSAGVLAARLRRASY